MATLLTVHVSFCQNPGCLMVMILADMGGSAWGTSGGVSGSCVLEQRIEQRHICCRNRGSFLEDSLPRRKQAGTGERSAACPPRHRIGPFFLLPWLRLWVYLHGVGFCACSVIVVSLSSFKCSNVPLECPPSPNEPQLPWDPLEGLCTYTSGLSWFWPV